MKYAPIIRVGGEDYYVKDSEVRDNAIMQIPSVTSSETYATLGDLPINSMTQVIQSVMNGYSDRPDKNKSLGGIVITSKGAKAGAYILQQVFYTDGTMYWRMKTTDWKAWQTAEAYMQDTIITDTTEYASLADFKDNSTYQVTTAAMKLFPDSPNLIDDHFGAAIVRTTRGSINGLFKCQTVTYINGASYVRAKGTSSWSEWKCLSISSGIITTANESLTSLGDLKANSIVAFTAEVFNGFEDKPFSTSRAVIVETYTPYTDNSNGKFQRVMDYNCESYSVRVYSGSWSGWKTYGAISNLNTASVMSNVVLSGTQKKIVLLGDSITQGLGSTGFVMYDNVRGNGPDYPGAGSDYQVGQYLYTIGNNVRIYYEALDGHGWAQLIKSYFESKFNCSVRNFGMSGANSEHLLDYLSQDTYPLTGFDIAIVMIGTNDRYQEANISKWQSYTNICGIIDKLQKNGQEVILMAPIPAALSDEEIATRQYHMEDVKHIAQKAAKKMSVPFISLYDELKDFCLYTNTALTSLLNSDGLHPNDTGYQVMLKIICKCLGLSYPIDGFTW